MNNPIEYEVSSFRNPLGGRIYELTVFKDEQEPETFVYDNLFGFGMAPLNRKIQALKKEGATER